MDGFIVETTRRTADAPGERSAHRWIGIAASAHDVLSLLDDPNARVVESGPDVLSRAHALEVREGEIELLP